MKSRLLILMLFIMGILQPALFSQKLSLQESWQKTREQYPVNEKSIQLIEASTREKLANVRTTWLPQFEIGAQGTWQNDVPHISGIPLAQGIPMAPQDQYKLGLEVSQVVFDGMNSKARMRQERAMGSIEKQNIEVQLKEVDYLVSEVYFMLLLLDEQQKQIDFLLDDLIGRLNEMSVAVSSGVVLSTEKQILEVEKLKVEKQQIALNENYDALLQSLALLTGLELTRATQLEFPEEQLLQQPQIRPEYDLFHYQKERVEADRDLNKVSLRPIVAAFGQIGYGNPGFNMLMDEFDTYYMVGIRLKWKPWDWNTSHRNRIVLDNQSSLIEMRRQAFELEQNRATLQMDAELSQYLQKMEKDTQIIEMQTSITRNYRSRLKNGTITASEYITVVNNESRAKLEMQITKLSYLQSLTKKYLVSGKE